MAGGEAPILLSIFKCFCAHRLSPLSLPLLLLVGKYSFSGARVFFNGPGVFPYFLFCFCFLFFNLWSRPPSRG